MLKIISYNEIYIGFPEIGPLGTYYTDEKGNLYKKDNKGKYIDTGYKFIEPNNFSKVIRSRPLSEEKKEARKLTKKARLAAQKIAKLEKKLIKLKQKRIGKEV